VSWQLASFALVLASLALAFWWYERSNPPAKLLAVIATLAAIAALGRDAFAAIPDVKPITAIVFVSGVAFGAGPGFAVGAIAGFASNFLLGQGPWTPWQMLGWGVVGLLGGGLGALTRRRLAPLVLALACAISAEVFNLILDAYTWVGTGNRTLAGYGIVLGQAATFDVTHVIASFVFGLAFGPVLLRMLVRVRSRLQVSWEPREGEPRPVRSGARLTLPLSVIAVLLVIPTIALGSAGNTASNASVTASAARVAVSRELSYLAGAQNNDGGFGGAPGQASSELYSAWAAIGLAAADRDPLSLRRGDHTVLEAIRREASSLEGAGDLERTILALYACGASVRSLPGIGSGGDPVAALLRYRDHDGSFGDLSNLTAFGVFALRAAGYAPGQAIVRAAASWLARQQNADGGFGFGKRGGGSDVDDTAAVLQALVDAGMHGGAAITRALAYLVHAQNPDGGYPQEQGGESNAQSTAWAVQGLIAAGRNPATVTRNGSRSPLGYLESLLAANGSVRYSRTGAQTPVWVTAQALTALAGRTFPIALVRAGTALAAETSQSDAVGRIARTARATLAHALASGGV
jgi:energy-coupling factor transport system substrate-specific component